MALIKSALELALERTANVEVDEAALEAQKAKTEGRKAAGKLLEGAEGFDFAEALQGIASAYRETYRKAVFEVLTAQVQLPLGTFDPSRMDAIGKGLMAVARAIPGEGGNRGSTSGAQKQVAALMQQIPAFISKYQEETKRVEQAIKTQWAPKFKEKERQLAARMGQDVRLDPMADPEFAAFYKQNVESLRKNYADALERAKSDLGVICGFADEA